MSKKKGSAFERKIASKLNDKFEPIFGKKMFRRNLDSGSYFGGSNKSRSSNLDLDLIDVGDIMVPKNFKFVIECKHYKKPPSIKQILYEDVKQWDAWIDQVEQDADTVDKLPMLIVKYNLIPEFVFVDRDVSTKLRPTISYKTWSIYLFDDLLTEHTNFFFVEE